MSTVRANSYYDTSGGSNAQLYGVASPPNSMGFRNRIINGDMRVDSRNVGASVSIAVGDRVTYGVDRFAYQKSSASYGVTAQRSTVAPTGFTNSLVTTVTSAFSPAAGDYLTLGQIIEGFNVADLGWGTANAQTITISFWVRSSVTGTYTFQVGNGAANRAYAVTYTVSAANTWEQKTATIAGDTSGTWATDNSGGLWVRWDLGSGSSFNGTTGSWQGSNYIKSSSQVTWANNASATFYITGVQLEAGSFPNGTQFERLDYGRQLIQCQRYFEKSFSQDTAPAHNTGGLPVIPIGGSLGCGGNAYFIVQMKVTKRTDGYTVRWYDPLAAHPSTENWLRAITACNSGSAVGPSSSLQLNSNTSNHFGGYAQVGTDVPPIFYWTVDAEL